MSRRRTRGGACALLVASLLMAGCGEDDPFASYCEEVKAQQTALSDDLAGGAPTGLIDALPEFEKLAAEAPDDLRDEWHTVTSRIGALVGALEDAGVDPATYDRKKPPEGLTDEERDAIDVAAKAMATPETAQALSGVEQHARDVCHTPLFL